MRSQDAVKCNQIFDLIPELSGIMESFERRRVCCGKSLVHVHCTNSTVQQTYTIQYGPFDQGHVNLRNVSRFHAFDIYNAPSCISRTEEALQLNTITSREGNLSTRRQIMGIVVQFLSL
jgi:hypothetical protein